MKGNRQRRTVCVQSCFHDSEHSLLTSLLVSVIATLNYVCVQSADLRSVDSVTQIQFYVSCWNIVVNVLVRVRKHRVGRQIVSVCRWHYLWQNIYSHIVLKETFGSCCPTCCPTFSHWWILTHFCECCSWSIPAETPDPLSLKVTWRLLRCLLILCKFNETVQWQNIQWTASNTTDLRRFLRAPGPRRVMWEADYSVRCIRVLSSRLCLTTSGGRWVWRDVRTQMGFQCETL